MKKSFKRAGVAVLSMAMLLSMGAVGAMSASATGEQTITLPATTSGFDIYTVATATKGDGVYSYTINTGYADVLTVDSATKKVSVKSDYSDNLIKGKNLNDITSYSAEAQALAQALKAKTTGVTPEKTVKANGKVDTDTALQLAPGYYLVLAKTVKDSEPILISVTDAAVTIGEVKKSDIGIIKAIEKIDGKTKTEGAAIGTDSVGNAGGTGLAKLDDTISFSLTTEFPKYNEESVKKAASGVRETNIDDFVITDIPEDSLAITFGTDFAGIIVSVNGSPVTKTANVNTDAADETYKIEEVAANYAAGKGKGFKITFDDDYVIKHRGESVVVTFASTLGVNKKEDTENPGTYIDSDRPDLNTDSNDNTVTLSYSNNYDTAKGTFEPDGTPDPENPKEVTDDAKIFCTIFTVNKQNESGSALDGATFKLESTDAGYSKTIVGTDIHTFEFIGLKPGTYTLTETSAPTNYKTADPITFTIAPSDADETAKDTTGYAGNFKFTSSDSKVTSDNVNVKNYPGQTLPGTGGIGTTLFTVGGAAVVLLAGFMFVFYMRKRKNEE